MVIVVMLDQVLNLTGEQSEAIARIFKETASQLVWVDDLRDRLFSGEDVDMTTANQQYQRIREASDQAVLDLLTDDQRNVYCELFEYRRTPDSWQNVGIEWSPRNSWPPSRGW